MEAWGECVCLHVESDGCGHGCVWSDEDGTTWMVVIVHGRAYTTCINKPEGDHPFLTGFPQGGTDGD